MRSAQKVRIILRSTCIYADMNISFCITSLLFMFVVLTYAYKKLCEHISRFYFFIDRVFYPFALSSNVVGLAGIGKHSLYEYVIVTFLSFHTFFLTSLTHILNSFKRELMKPSNCLLVMFSLTS